MQKIKAKKSLGQNFLIDDEALSDIASAIEVHKKHIIEVGPGYGALTDYLIKEEPTSLDLIELDGDMVSILEKRVVSGEWGVVNQANPLASGEKLQGARGGKLPESEEKKKTAQQSDRVFAPSKPFASFQLGKKGISLSIRQEDVLDFIPPYEHFSVIANIPYYITSPILFHFLYPKNEGTDTLTEDTADTHRNGSKTLNTQFTTFNSPREMVIMMQEEVGEKILAGRNKKPHYSYLSLAMELACEDIEIVRYVGRESFDPIPNVDSIVLKFRVRESRDRELEERLLSLWRIAFTHPRKTLLSNLKGSHYDIEGVKKWLTKCGYDDKVRAEAVGMEEWKSLI